jgi:hypothetical protein
MLKKLLKTHRVNIYQIQVFFFFFLAIFLILNIAASQTISPVYFNLVEGGRKNAVVFLQKIRGLPMFKNELKNQQKIYGETIIDDVFEEENVAKERIKNFERTLEKNVYSRDILYSLYLLHKQKGDDLTAEKYLRQVREIDPSF